jgi:UDP-N-acetylmuramoyl-tripeptide--D-alanyl-D-alanine ligase
MKLTLREVAEMLDLSPLPENSAGIVAGWSVDSRTLQPGDMYFALRGPNHDGHAYVAECFAKAR